ncbi:hypothetical protein ACQU0X_25965 [Pseudovibrio ascidiaceicola]|uniref:hypothetical protein n=1 Tax=Pseudovibrio ascidiaceicola TaxID=285279 RepID=UPI003D36FA20
MIKMWHGSKRWTGVPEIRQSKRGKAEAGPGIYLTTSQQRARSYARGGGCLVHFELDPKTKFAHEVQLDPADALQFLECVRLSNRQLLEKDVAYETNEPGKLRETICAETLITLMINTNNSHGRTGKDFCDYLVARGVQAGFHRAYGNEDWIVVHDTSIIKSSRKVYADQLENYARNYPEVKEQLAQCQQMELPTQEAALGR